MLTSKFSRVGLSCALATMLVAAAPAVRSFAAAGNTSVKMLNAELPPGVTLAKATCPQTIAAVKAAAAKRPDLAVRILNAALASKGMKDAKCQLDCSSLVKLVNAAAMAAPDKTRELTENAMSADPECSSDLDKYLSSGGPGTGGAGTGAGAAEGGVTGDTGEGGLGAGFGPGFPGSPGFTGSSAGGSFALPPLGEGLTEIRNG